MVVNSLVNDKDLVQYDEIWLEASSRKREFTFLWTNSLEPEFYGLVTNSLDPKKPLHACVSCTIKVLVRTYKLCPRKPLCTSTAKVLV